MNNIKCKDMDKLNKKNNNYFEKLFSIKSINYIGDHKFEIIIKLIFNDIEINFVFDILNETVNDLMNDFKKELDKQINNIFLNIKEQIDNKSYYEKKYIKKIKTKKRDILVNSKEKKCICKEDDCKRNN